MFFYIKHITTLLIDCYPFNGFIHFRIQSKSPKDSLWVWDSKLARLGNVLQITYLTEGHGLLDGGAWSSC
jgi:hypothetical protein